MNTFEQTQNLLRTRAELRSKLALIPYDGTVEVKAVNDLSVFLDTLSEMGSRDDISIGAIIDIGE